MVRLPASLCSLLVKLVVNEFPAPGPALPAPETEASKCMLLLLLLLLPLIMRLLLPIEAFDRGTVGEEQADAVPRAGRGDPFLLLLPPVALSPLMEFVGWWLVA